MSKQKPKGGIKNGRLLVLREEQKMTWGNMRKMETWRSRSPVASVSDGR